ncbi:MAG: discoidin domain-containing protein [Acidobacteriaceae bacterium]
MSTSRRKFLGTTIGAAALTMVRPLADAAILADQIATPPSLAPTLLRVHAAPDQIVNSFDPDKALATSMDIQSRGAIDRIYTPETVKLCLSAGWGPISYRLHTPETIDYWHWNPKGQWTDEANQRGYFVGSSELGEPIRDSFGYSLPHRGCTHNGGTDRGYSRLTDGDPNTFWKSNPYLTQAFTHDDDSLHPQWIIVDLGEYYDVNAIRIDWCEPCARDYQVEYWVGADPMNWEEPAMDSTGQGGEYLPVSNQAMGKWVRFPNGVVRDGKGGSVTLKLSENLMTTRWVRVVMTKSSNRPGPHGTDDQRHRVGYAIYEVYLGRLAADGKFADFVKHGADGRLQTATYCSSTDPWHTVQNLNPHGDQTGWDIFYSSGITNNLPALITVPLIYSVPEDAAAMVAYLKKRGYPISWVEMDEEADGQYYMPEDYASLYIQVADAIHKVDPTLKLGGPVYQGINQDASVWPNARGDKSWFRRFYDYLKARNRQADLTFASFEIYPFDACTMKWDDLYRNRELTRKTLQSFRDDGLPVSVPLMNTESNLSGSLSVYMSDIFSALWLADNVGSFFAEGGALYIHSPIEPSSIEHGCQGYAIWGNVLTDREGKIINYMAFYHAGRMINEEWVTHRTGMHHLYSVDVGIQDVAGNDLVTSYAVRRPDGHWALLLINKDRENAHAVRVAFANGDAAGYFLGAVRVVTFGSEQYVWHGADATAHADPDLPPVVSSVDASAQTMFTLPKASVTVLRGEVAGFAT